MFQPEWRQKIFVQNVEVGFVIGAERFGVEVNGAYRGQMPSTIMILQ